LYAILLLKKRVILPAALDILGRRYRLLAAKYDLLKEKYMIFPIDL